jgi:hypothetical protein
MKENIINFIERHFIKIVYSGCTKLDLNNKILTINTEDEENSIIETFPILFSTFCKSSFVEKKIMTLLDTDDKDLVHSTLVKEVEGHLKWRLGKTKEYRSDNPQLFFVIRSLLFNLNTLHLYKPLYDEFNFEATGDFNKSVAKSILKDNNYVLTGSYALSLQGSIYRDLSTGICDIDIITSKGVYEIIRDIDERFTNIVKVYTNKEKVLCLAIPENVTLAEYHIVNGSLFFYVLKEKDSDREVGWFEYSQRKEGTFLKSGEKALLIDIVSRPKGQIDKAVDFKLDEMNIKAEHYSAILDVKLTQGRTKDIMDYTQYKVW